MQLVAKDPRKIGKMSLAYTDDVASELRGEILSKAHEEFGYVGESFGARGPLAKALEELDIQPLKTAEVEQYKASKTKVVHDTRHRVAAHLLVSLIIPAALFAAFFAVIRAFHFHETSDFRWGDGVFIACLLASLVSIVAGNMHFGEALHTKNRTWAWTEYGFGTVVRVIRLNGKQYSANKYTGYVPVHVLNLALQVREAAPTASFGVDELTLSMEAVPKPLPDPFLTVELGSEKYYLAVWDEREFEAKM